MTRCHACGLEHEFKSYSQLSFRFDSTMLDFTDYATCWKCVAPAKSAGEGWEIVESESGHFTLEGVKNNESLHSLAMFRSKCIVFELIEELAAAKREAAMLYVAVEATRHEFLLTELTNPAHCAALRAWGDAHHAIGKAEQALADYVERACE